MPRTLKQKKIKKYDITAQKVVRAFESLKKLYELGIITEPDFELKKSRLINGLKNLKIAENPLEFLSVILPLNERGTLTDEEVLTIKVIIEAHF